MTADSLLMKSALIPLAKFILIPLGLLGLLALLEMSTADAVIQNRIYGSGTTALIVQIKKSNI